MNDEANGRDTDEVRVPIWRETWLYEQLTHGALVAIALLASLRALHVAGLAGTQQIGLVLVSAVVQLVAQKQRSFATRQEALERRLGHDRPRLRCAARQPFWAQAQQVLGAFVGVATVPTLAHLPLVIWAALAYDLWRRHRERRHECSARRALSSVRGSLG